MERDAGPDPGTSGDYPPFTVTRTSCTPSGSTAPGGLAARPLGAPGWVLWALYAGCFASGGGKELVDTDTPAINDLVLVRPGGDAQP
ncbi:MAG: hypothetical protein M3Y04_09020 [Actinomycetota bacterium]|nr:hypothetical protein [Actinomycetota bacterium]